MVYARMEAISNALQPHKDIIGLAAGLVTILQFMSGSIICRDIIRKKSTDNISILPFIGGLVIGVLSLQYGWMLKDTATIYVNVAGILFNIVYLWIYANFLKPGPQMLEATKIANVGCAITTACLAYAWFEEPSLVEFRYGMVITSLLLLLIASPLFNVGEVIRTRDTSSLPFPLILMGTIVSFLWLLYGLALQNEFMIAQNVAGFVLSAIQLSLFVIYPQAKQISTRPSLEDDKDK